MYLLPESVLQGLLAYLQSKPYIEVHEGIAALQNLQKQQTEEQ